MKIDKQDLLLRYKGILSILIILIFTQMGITTVFPYLTKFIVDSVLIEHNILILKRIIIVTVVLIAIQIPLNILISYLCAKWTQLIVFDLRMSLSKIFLEKKENSKNNGQFVNTIINDCELIGNQLLHIALNSVPNIFLFILYFYMLLRLSTKLTLLIVLSIPVFLLVSFTSSKQIFSLTKQIQSYRDKLIGFLNHHVKNKLLIDLYDLTGEEKERYSNIISKVKETNIKSDTIMSFLNNLSSLVIVITPLISLFIGSLMVFNNVMSLGSLIAFNTYTGLLFSPISKILTLPPMYSQMLVSIDRIQQSISDSHVSLEIKSHYSKILFTDDTVLEVDKLIPIIDNSPLSIEPLSFKIHKGEFIRLEGPNGIGKSLILQCIVQYHDSFQGFIFKENHISISYVPQENFLFDGTIFDNLTKGLHNIDRNKVDYYIKLLNFDVDPNKEANPFIVSLSSGQLQKIKIIRALLADSDMLIFDEALANLDKKTVKNLLEYLDRKKITAIFAYHGDFDTLISNHAYTSFQIFQTTD